MEMRPDVSNVCILFVLSTLLCARANSLCLKTVINITQEVIKKYNSACAFLVYSKRQQESLYLGIIKKSLSTIGVFISTKTIEDFSHSPELEQQKPLYIIVTSDSNTELALSQLSKTVTLTKGKWLMFLETTVPVNVFFNGTNIPFDSEFLVAQGSEDYEVQLTELYQVRPSYPLQQNRVAVWTSVDGATWTTVPLHLRRNLQGITLKCVFVPEPPYVTVDRETPQNLSGYSVELHKVLQHRMNYTSLYYIPNQVSYGTRHENGTWSGMVGEVFNKRADMGLNLFMVTAKRSSAVDYFPPIFNTKMMVHIRKSQTTRSTFKHVISEFNGEMWMAIAVAMTILIFLLSLSWYIGVSYNHHQEMNTYRLQDACFYTLGIICQQAHHKTPKSWPCRLIYLTTYITALILFVAYSAIFISFLAVRRSHLPFTNFEGLLQDGTYALGVIKNSEREAYFKTSEDKTLKQVHRKLIEPYSNIPPRNDEDGLMRTCKDAKYSYFCTQITVRGLAKRLPCVIVEIAQAYFSTTVSMIMQKSSPYKKFFSRHLQEMKRSGILNRIDEKIWPRLIYDFDQKSEPSVTLDTVSVMFVILVTGVVLSIAFLLFEVVVHRLCRIKRQL